MEKIPYEEAREWFWVRTGVWFVPAFLITGIGSFFYAGDVIETFKTRLLISLGTAFASTVLGLLATIVSIQFPWMRLGRTRLWWLNATVCAVIAALSAAGASAVSLTLLRNDPKTFPSQAVLDVANSMIEFGIAASAAWGAGFGAWFALRLDKYFVESI